MKSIILLIAASLLSIGVANANDQFLGPWAASEKEVLQITKDGDKLSAEFIRENVKFEFEQVRYPATIENGALVISGEQGRVTAKFDDKEKVLVIGGMKAFQRLTAEQAAAIIARLQKK